MFTLASGAVSLKASLQDYVVLSSAETKFMSLTFMAKEAIWLGFALGLWVGTKKCRYTL